MQKVDFKPFANICEQNVNRGIYCWGCQGQKLSELSEAFICRRETSTSNAKRVIKLWKQRKDLYPDAIATDCSGLLMYYLQNICGVSGDKTANGIYVDFCTPISKSEAKDGDMVFKGTKSKKTHIGYIINGRVISAKGRDYGIVDTETGWSYYARFNWWKEETPSVVGYGITRNLRRKCKGEDVKKMQEALNVYGYGLELDVSFGAKTEKAVKAFQKSRGLTADGIAGKNTINILAETGIVYWAK